MTIAPAPSISVITPSGTATGPWNTDWTFVENSDVRVYIETGGEAGPDLVEGVDYTLTAPNPQSAGGAITLFPSAVPVGGWVTSGANATRLIFRRRTARRQATALPDIEGHKPRATEQALDRAMRIAQEITDEQALTVKVPPGATPPSPADLAAAAAAGAKIEEALNKSEEALDGVESKMEADAANAVPASFSANAPFLPPTTEPDDIPYSLRSRLQERRSVMEFIPRVLHAGIRAGTGLIPVHAFIQAALDSGAKYIDFPEGVFPIGPTAWLRVTLDGQQLRGSGDGTIVKRQGADGVAAYPMLVAQGEGNIVVDIAFKCEAQDSLPPVVNNIAFASGVIIMGDGSYAEGLSIHDAWDNGLAFGRFDTTTGVFNPGEPAGGEAVAIYTYNCGCGVRPDAPGFPRHQAGGGVNNLNGQGIRFRDCVDWFSRTGWINDYASGATATFSGMISYYPRKSRVDGDSAGFPTEYSRFGGFGCYVAGRAQMQNCEVYDPEADGVWIDGFSHNCNISGVRVKGAKQRGFRIQGRDHLIKNLISEDCSYGNTGVYPAVLVEGTSDGADGTLNSRNIMIDGIVTTGPYHTYGLQVLAGGDADRKVHGFAANMQLNGTLGQVDNPNYASFALRGYGSSVPDATAYSKANSVSNYDGTIIIRGEGTNAAANPWGTSAGRGQLWITERRDTTKRLVVGMDGDRGVGVLQALQSGVAPRAIDINPDPAETRTWTGVVLGAPALLRFDWDHLPKLLGGLTAVETGSADLRMIQMGHSIPQAYRSNAAISTVQDQYGNIAGQAFSTVLANMLSSALGAVVRTSGWFGDAAGATSSSTSQTSNTSTARWRSDTRLTAYTAGTGHWIGQTGARLGGNRLRNIASTNRFRFTDALAVDTVETYYDQVSTGGTLSIAANNGTAIATQDVTGTDGTPAKLVTALGSRAVQSADAWRSAGTVDVSGQVVYDSTIKQAILLNAAKQGSRIANWIEAAPLAQLALYGPDVIFMQIDLNEWLGDVAPATFKADYQTWITAALALASAPDIVLMVSSTPNPATVRAYPWEDYRTAIYELAEDNDLALVDWGLCVGYSYDFAVDQDFIQPLDGLHWLSAFHTHAGVELAAAIVSRLEP